MNIYQLNEYPQYAPILAYWSFTQWYRSRNIPFTAILQDYINRSRNTSPPICWVAVNDQMLPVGMVSLKYNDLWSRPDLNPWLASLYVVPEYRFKKIGDQLIQAVISKAKSLGFSKLYLFEGHSSTIDLIEYYSKRGFSILETGIDNDGNPTTIMCLQLSDSSIQ